MKRSKFFIPSLLSFAMLLSFCTKKDDTTTTPTATTSNSLSCNIAGTAFSTSLVSGVLVSNLIEFAGVTASGGFPSVTVIIPRNAPVGSHDIYAYSAVNYAVAYNATSATSDSYSSMVNSTIGAKDGNITISSIDTNKRVVSGTFTATVTNSSGGSASKTVAITNGAFTGTYSK